VREGATNFRQSEKEEEPPLRKLSYGLKGEGVECQDPPYKYMIKSRNGLWYPGYRFDMALCDEAAHTTPRLRELFGSQTESRGAYFRQVLGYGARTKTQVDDSCRDWIESLSSILSPACLSVYKDAEVVRLFSVYTNLLLAGHTVCLHLDVPEFLGLDRSCCPSWLLVAAHCSGLFSKYRVRNVTCVCYPKSSEGGSLAVYHPTEGGVHRVEGATALVLDTDTYFHHSSMAGHGLTDLTDSLPDVCSLDTVHEHGELKWRVKKHDKVLAVCSEPEIRISVSCKFHVFRNRQEEEKFYSLGEEDFLTVETILDVMVKDLESKGKLPSGWSTQDTPLYILAPVLVREYILSQAPTSEDIENMWEVERERTV